MGLAPYVGITFPLYERKDLKTYISSSLLLHHKPFHVLVVNGKMWYLLLIFEDNRQAFLSSPYQLSSFLVLSAKFAACKALR